MLSLLTILTSCSVNSVVKKPILDVELTSIIETGVDFEDLAYSSSNKTLYLCENKTSKIWIYNKNEYLNTIGGNGFGEYKFERLSDIAISKNGNLLALDNLKKAIKIYDSNGEYLSTISLNKLNNPMKFSVDRNDFLYVYDNNDHEIVVLNLMNNSEFIRFGQFEIDLPTNMYIHDDIINFTTYNNQSDYYSVMGDFIVSDNIASVMDRYQNRISTQDRFLTINSKIVPGIILPKRIKQIYISDDCVIIGTNKQIQLYKIKY